ncbi:MAG: helix-turn-helix domain-containing protein [Clostridiales bacterium]|jgi:hypothetical protein|nr:helix-turn-helix domain-containing protein [Clostridiales bacterium]
MDDTMRQMIAAFKFSLIAPICNGTFDATSKEAYYRRLASKEYTLPNGKTAKFRPVTFKSWYLSYTKFGLEALAPKGRNDAGRSRVLTDAVIAEIHSMKEKYPFITGTLIYKMLIEEGFIKNTEVSRATVLRYIKANHLKWQEIAPIGRKA